MLRRQHTGLASVTLQNADKLRDWKTPMEALIKQLQAAGEDYADAVNQAELIVRSMEDLYDKTLDLAALILKADRAKAVQGEAKQEEPREKVAGQHRKTATIPGHDKPAGETPPGSSPGPAGE